MSRNTIGIVPLLCCFPAFSQNQATPPSFEAATVRANKSGETRMAVDFQAGGRFSATNVPLKILIALAYHVRPEAVTGGPGWLGSDRFDIVAKALQTTSSDEIRRMLQTLLAEQFKLKLHTDQKIMPAYALLPGKTGPKLQPSSEPALLTDQRCRPGDANAGQRQVECEHMTMALFADTLQELAPREIDAPVVDQTGVQGTYSFNLVWAPAVLGDPANPLDPAAGPTLFEALDSQLGLRLQSKKLPLAVIVIDRVERVLVEN
jgi:uncharacterized protein (TIGR03435 family)